MRKIWKLTASIAMILVISLAIFLPIYFLVEFSSNNPKLDNYIYPNPLWNNGSYTDLFVENDSLVHFGIVKTTQYSDINDVIYCKLDFNNDSFHFKQRYSDDILVNYYQIRIQIDAEYKPFIYLYGQDSFGYSFGETITIEKEKWKENAAFLDAPLNCSLISRTAVLDWHPSNSNETIISFIYSPPWIQDDTTPSVITPVIYNTSSKQSIFMHEIFPEIENHYSIAPGDFSIINNTLALTWTRVISYNEHYPYLAIKWETEGWKLYKLSGSIPPSIPIAIIPSNNSINVFYYEDGIVNNISRIYHITITNSTNIVTKEIMSSNGQMFFYDDSISYQEDGTYYFVFTGKINSPDEKTELFLGRYKGDRFERIRITSTDDYSEAFANCDFGREYLHIAWTSFYKGNNSELLLTPNTVYYLRFSLEELDKIFAEGFHLFIEDNHSNIINYSYKFRIPTLMIFEATFVAKRKENRKLKTYIS